ncbi:hypothetical protein [Spongiivirga citrea]|uniref:Uncharacterized protein n=1 Tax=Spongiivirga citrea TaxID=1481457 RepID=A0A6M0CPZ1_9FLAO|nr:hypothetical protein [Spongiivirga citrea]NER16000.1 hypothetical protein [Spongiivirga citrea]
MANVSFSDIIDQRSDEALFNLLTVERGLYKKEAIAYAEIVFQKRGLELKTLQQSSKRTTDDLATEVKNRLKYGESVAQIIQHFNARGLELSKEILVKTNEKIRIENNIDLSRKLIVFIPATVIFVIACITHLISQSIYRIGMGIFFSILSMAMLRIIYRLLKRKTPQHRLETTQIEK